MQYFSEESYWRIFSQAAILCFLIINYLFAVEEGGVTAEPLENEKVSLLCLSKEEALSLGQLGVQLEWMFGGPRDIEWALSKVSNSLLFISWDFFTYYVFFMHCVCRSSCVFRADCWVGRHDKANTVAAFYSYFANTLQNSVATWSKHSQPFFLTARWLTLCRKIIFIIVKIRYFNVKYFGTYSNHQTLKG